MIDMVFVTFAAWFYGMNVEVAKLIQLIGTGFVGSFAKSVVTIPMLLDLAEIPADIFNLFLAVGVVSSRFGDLMKAMHLLTFSVLTASYMMGRFRFNTSRLLSRGLTTAIVVGCHGVWNPDLSGIDVSKQLEPRESGRRASAAGFARGGDDSRQL